ncbi:MAG: PAS domain S-box protein [Phycisphaerales bacterium]|nr:PAS domain S-box protein [Phycisphaerales bacterium]
MHQAKNSATSQNATWKHARRHTYGLGKLLLVVIRYRLTVAIGTLILLVGICLTLWMAARTDRLMRDEMLRQACLVAEAINLDLVQALTGTEADLESPEFLRLKDQFACVRSANPGYRFIYLMGRKTDGTVIFLNDDEPLDVEDFTPPGTRYEEVPEGYLRVFDTRVSAIVGPVTDRWGTFITALVPLIDPHSRDLVAILGIDIIVRDWIWDLCTQAALPVGLFTLALLLVLTIGSWLLAWRSCSEGPPPWTQHLEPALTIAIGLVLTIFATWFAHETESRNRSQSFRNLADSRTAAVEDTFRDLRYVELEGLAKFYEGSAEVTEREYRHYTEYLSQNPLIQAWGWIPVVPASEKDRFEQTARAAGMDDFGIWQRNATGSRMPAAGREVYYPVFQVAPLTSNQQDIGFDLGSEPVNREAIAEAIRTGMTSATYPAVLIKENLNQHGMLIFRPVFDKLQPQNPQGLALAVLRLSDVLTTAYYDPLIALELLIAYSDGTPESLIVSWSSADTPPPSQLKASRPIMAFGKTLIVTAYAGPDFLRLHPTRAGPLATLIGLLLTAAVTIVVSVLLRRHRGLEEMVRQRTSDLRSSEEHLAATLRSIGDGVITCDRAGRISSLNTVAECLTGWTTTEATNHPIEEIFRIINAQTRQVAVNPVECALRVNAVLKVG